MAITKDCPYNLLLILKNPANPLIMLIMVLTKRLPRQTCHPFVPKGNLQPDLQGKNIIIII